MSKHIRVEIGFGLEYDKNQHYIENPLSALTPVFKEAVRLFGCYTFFDSSGGWTNPAGVLTEEQGGTILVCLEDTEIHRREVRMLATFVKSTLNQEAVALSITPTEFELI